MTVIDAPPAQVPDELTPQRGRWHRVRPFLPLVALVVLAILPYSTISLPGIFEGPVNSPGTLQLLAICLIFGGLAAGYDLLFGRTGMLSFGHALYFAAGVYGTDILITRAGLPLWQAALLTITGGTILAALLGAVALRTVGIAFAMVTLAFAQVGAILVARDFGGLTGGEEGLPLDVSGLPAGLVGVTNTVNLYWLALAYLTLVVFVVHRVSGSPTGRVLAGLRDDERRIGVLGLDPYRYKLVAFTLAAWAGVGGRGGLRPHRRRRVAAHHVLRADPVAAGHGGARWTGHPVGAGARRCPLHVPGPPAHRVRNERRGGQPAGRPQPPAEPAAVRPGHCLHPGRLLLPRRPDEPGPPPVPPDPHPPPPPPTLTPTPPRRS